MVGKKRKKKGSPGPTIAACSPGRRGFRLRKHIPHRLPRDGGIPHPVRSSAAELGSGAVLAAAARGLAQDGLEVPALRVGPAAHKVGRILAERGVEGVLGLGVGQGLDDERELVVQRGDLPHVGRVLRVGGQGDHLLPQGVVDGDADVVDRGGGVLVELLVHADRVGQLDGVHGARVRADVLGDLGEEHLVAAEDLFRIRVLASFLGLQDKRSICFSQQHTDFKRSSQRTCRFSSSSCNPMALI